MFIHETARGPGADEDVSPCNMSLVLGVRSMCVCVCVFSGVRKPRVTKWLSEGTLVAGRLAVDAAKQCLSMGPRPESLVSCKEKSKRRAWVAAFFPAGQGLCCPIEGLLLEHESGSQPLSQSRSLWACWKTLQEG